MATRQSFQLTTAERRKRIFSEDFKRKKVREIELKITTIAEISRQYQIRYNNVSKWIKRYSSSYKKGVRLIVEMESDTKKLIALQAKIAELERIIGQKAPNSNQRTYSSRYSGSSNFFLKFHKKKPPISLFHQGIPLKPIFKPAFTWARSDEKLE